MAVAAEAGAAIADAVADDPAGGVGTGANEMERNNASRTCLSFNPDDGCATLKACNRIQKFVRSPRYLPQKLVQIEEIPAQLV